MGDRKSKRQGAAARSGKTTKRAPAVKAPDGAAPAAPTTAESVGDGMSPEQRRKLIAERAYLRAERRGFVGGDPVADWLESEKEVDRLPSLHGH